MKYYAKTYTADPKTGLLTPGEYLTDDQVKALGEDRLKDMVARGVLCAVGGDNAKPQQPAKSDKATAPVDDNDDADDDDNGDGIDDGGDESEDESEDESGENAEDDDETGDDDELDELDGTGAIDEDDESDDKSAAASAVKKPKAAKPKTAARSGKGNKE